TSAGSAESAQARCQAQPLKGDAAADSASNESHTSGPAASACPSDIRVTVDAPGAATVACASAELCTAPSLLIMWDDHRHAATRLQEARNRASPRAAAVQPQARQCVPMKHGSYRHLFSRPTCRSVATV